MPLFLDIGPIPEDISNRMLEGLYKALSDDGDRRDGGIWKPMDSTFLKRLVEILTQRGLDRLGAALSKFLSLLSGKPSGPGAPLGAPPPLMTRWTPEQLAAAKAHIESIPPSIWTLDDHMLAAEFVIQTYLAPDVMTTEAE